MFSNLPHKQSKCRDRTFGLFLFDLGAENTWRIFMGILNLFNKSKLPEHKVEPKVIINNMSLETVSCDVLKKEIDRRKQDNYNKKLREANQKADIVDKNIDNIIKETKGINKKDVSYEEKLTDLLFSKFYYASINRYSRDSDYDRTTFRNCIFDIVTTVDQDSCHLNKILEYCKENYRKDLVNNIKSECK